MNPGQIDLLFSREEEGKYVNAFVAPLTNAVSNILKDVVVDEDERKRVVCKILLGPMYTGNHTSIHNYFNTNWVDTITATAVGGDRGETSIVVSKNVTVSATNGSSISGPNISPGTSIVNSTYSITDSTTTIHLSAKLLTAVSGLEDAYKITTTVQKPLIEHLKVGGCPGQFLFLGITNLTSIFSHLGKHNIRKRVTKAKAVVVCTITCITTTTDQVLINRWDRGVGTEVNGGNNLPGKTVVLTLKDPHEDFLNEKKCTFQILYPTITQQPWVGHFTLGNKIYITGVNQKKFNTLRTFIRRYARETRGRVGVPARYMLTIHIGKFTHLAAITN